MSDILAGSLCTVSVCESQERCCKWGRKHADDLGPSKELIGRKVDGAVLFPGCCVEGTMHEQAHRFGAGVRMWSPYGRSDFREVTEVKFNVSTCCATHVRDWCGQ